MPPYPQANYFTKLNTKRRYKRKWKRQSATQDQRLSNQVRIYGHRTDVLIGLQLSGVGQKDFDVNEAKKQTPREVEAVILKNRNGATGDTLHYAYYSMFNKFLDMDDAEGGTEKLTTAPHTQVDDEGRVFNSEE